MRKNTIFNYQQLSECIKESAQRHGRLEKSIQLLAVSKKQSAESIRHVYELGQTAFGENYVQEMIEKQQALADLDIEWHFIGTFQSNKAAKIAEHCAWLHTLTSLKGASKLNQQRDPNKPPLNCCIQYNTANDPNKSGLQDDAALLELARHVGQLPNLTLRGLMTIPSDDRMVTQQAFAALRKKLHWLQQALPEQTLDTLSMGMSADLELAIAEGSTCVRVGSALFGARAV